MKTGARLVIATAVIGVGVLGARPLLQRTGFFTVRQLEILGTRYLTGADVASAVALEPTASLFDDVGPIAERAEAIAGVERAEVWKRWPATIVVRVVERAPVALTPADGRVQLLDGRGRVLPFDPTRAPPDLPIALTADAGIAGVLGLVREIEPELYAAVETAARRNGAVALDLGGGHEVWFADPAPPQIQAVAAVLRDLRTRGVRFRELDGRFTDWVFVRGMAT